MNEQSLAILRGAVAQLTALEQSTQTLIDADKADAADAQSKLDADNADIAANVSGLAVQVNITTALQNLIEQFSNPQP